MCVCVYLKCYVYICLQFKEFGISYQNIYSNKSSSRRWRIRLGFLEVYKFITRKMESSRARRHMQELTMISFLRFRAHIKGFSSGLCFISRLVDLLNISFYCCILRGAIFIYKHIPKCQLDSLSVCNFFCFFFFKKLFRNKFV